MHINISSLHNAYIFRRAHLYTDTFVVLVRLSRASPQLFASTFPHAGQGLPSPRSHPRQLGLAMSASPFFFFPHTNPVLQTPPQKRMVEVCDAKRVTRYLPLARVGRSLWKNYSDICMCHGYKAPGVCTHPLHEASPIQPAACLPAAPPLCTCGNHFSNY